jgi:hypothetical protein
MLCHRLKMHFLGIRVHSWLQSLPFTNKQLYQHYWSAFVKVHFARCQDKKDDQY